MGNQLMIGMLVFAMLSGTVGGIGLSKMFRGNKSANVAKSEQNREEYFRDKVKGIEYKMKEGYKNQTPVKTTLGQKLGNLVDNFIGLFVVGAIFVFFLMPGVFWGVVNRLRHSLKVHRNALKQTIDGIEKAKPKLNGEEEKLKEALRDKQDTATKKIVADLKNPEV